MEGFEGYEEQPPEPQPALVAAAQPPNRRIMFIIFFAALGLAVFGAVEKLGLLAHMRSKLGFLTKTFEQSIGMNSGESQIEISLNASPKPSGTALIVKQNAPEAAAHFVAAESSLSSTGKKKTSLPASETQIPAVPAAPPAAPVRVVIVALGITGGVGKTDNDFIKIAAQNGETVLIGGWKLRKRTQSGAESSVKVFPQNAAIPANGMFVWANSGNAFDQTIGANVSSSAALTDNSSVALFNASGTLVDAVAWGSGQSSPYGEAAAFPQNPGVAQVLMRVSSGGTFRDTGNNAGDFVLR